MISKKWTKEWAKKWSLGLCVMAGFIFMQSAHAAKSITLIAEDDWYPYSAQRNGVSEGFVVDVIRSAYATVGVDVKFKVASFKSCMKQVEEGVEIGCFDINLDNDTNSRFLFHNEALFVDTGGIYDMEKSGFPDKVTPQNLVGYRVGYTNGDTYGEYLDNAPGIQREYAMSDVSNLKKLVAGRQDYSLISTITAQFIFKTHAADFPVLPRLVGIISNQKMFVGFSLKRAESKEAAALLDEGLIKIRADGTYKKIETQWLGVYLPADKPAKKAVKK